MPGIILRTNHDESSLWYLLIAGLIFSCYGWVCVCVCMESLSIYLYLYMWNLYLIIINIKNNSIYMESLSNN